MSQIYFERSCFQGIIKIRSQISLELLNKIKKNSYLYDYLVKLKTDQLHMVP